MASDATARSGRRVAIFGGSFNPPHVAHALGCVLALSTCPVDEVLVVPVFRHPFAKELASFEDRLAMCELAMGWLPGVTISTLERELGGESLTLRTVTHLAGAFPEAHFRLLVGADVLGDVHKWHRWDRIAELAPPLVLGRAGFGGAAAGGLRAPEPLLPRVSSSELREALGRGDPVSLASIEGLLPSRVAAYVAERGLYRAEKGA